MAYLALYRRYRPNSFDKLIGQEHITKTLINQIQTGRLGHAYLFTGTRGTGKTSAAKIFAKAINCENPVNGSPCGVCKTCLALNDASNIDIIEIDAASNNGVNEIRDLREKVQYPPSSCKYKVYIIDEVHMLTSSAFNALLKTLEEPPKHAVFILATTEVHKIPATILSRCMRFDFRLISAERIAELIANIYDEVGKAYEKEAVFALATAGEGSIRDALSVADIALSYSNNKLTYNDVMDILGSSNAEIINNFVLSIINGDAGRVVEIIDALCGLGKSMGVLTKDVVSLIRNLIIIKTCNNPNKILLLPEEKFNALYNVSNATTEERLIRILQIFSDMESSLRYSVHPRITFESSAIKATRPDVDYDIDALIARVKELENKLNDANLLNKLSAKKEQAPMPAINVEEPKAEAIIKPQKQYIYQAQAEIYGKLLFNLRNNGNEMLWNVMQSVKVEVEGNILSLTVSNNSDAELLDKTDMRAQIQEALNEFMPFELSINVCSEEQKLSEVDDETEKIRKIFGDDIVIVKE